MRKVRTWKRISFRTDAYTETCYHCVRLVEGTNLDNLRDGAAKAMSETLAMGSKCEYKTWPLECIK